MQPDIKTGVLKAFNAGTYRATVQLTGSLLLNVADIPVSRDIASGDLVTDRKVAVALFDPSNPADAVVFAVWT